MFSHLENTYMVLRAKKIITLTKKSLNGTKLGVWLYVINFIGMGPFLQRVYTAQYLKCVMWTFLYPCAINHKKIAYFYWQCKKEKETATCQVNLLLSFPFLFDILKQQ